MVSNIWKHSMDSEKIYVEEIVDELKHALHYLDKIGELEDEEKEDRTEYFMEDLGYLGIEYEEQQLKAAAKIISREFTDFEMVLLGDYIDNKLQWALDIGDVPFCHLWDHICEIRSNIETFIRVFQRELDVSAADNDIRERLKTGYEFVQRFPKRIPLGHWWWKNDEALGE